MNKKNLSELDIRTKFITPNIVAAGWDINNQMREDVYFTDGRIHVRGKMHARGKAKKADYILYYNADSTRKARRWEGCSLLPFALIS